MVKERTEAQRARAAKSRLPHPVQIAPTRNPHQAPSESAEAINTPADVTAVDKSEHVRYALLALGAPPVSSDDMRRLCKGPLGDALFFVAEHMKGRAEVSRARQIIQQTREADSSSRAMQTEFMKAKRAAAKLNGAKNDFKEAETQMNSRLESIAKSQREADRLQAVLDKKRRALLSLQVLEKKETVRLARIKEVDQLMSQLQLSRRDSSWLTPDDIPLSAKDPLSPRLRLPAKRILADHTQDALSALQAYHIRLSRAASASDDARQGAEARREASEARLHSALGDDSGSDLLEKCKEIARRRAERSMRYESPLHCGCSDGVDDDSLDEIHARVCTKEANLQHLLNEIADLEKACAHSLQTLSAFDELTQPALRQSLQEEVKPLEGYIDTLKLSIMQSVDDPGPQDDSVVGGKSWRQALADVQVDVEQAHAKGTFVSKTTLLEPSAVRDGSASARINELIASHRARQVKVNERNTALLARKLEKALFGDMLESQIEKLVAERGIISAMSGSSK